MVMGAEMNKQELIAEVVGKVGITMASLIGKVLTRIGCRVSERTQK